MKKKRILSALLAVLLAVSLVPAAGAAEQPFSDVGPDFWASDSICEAYDDGVMTGTGVNEYGVPVFSPSSKLTIAQFATVLTRAFYNEDVLNSTRPDVWPNRNIDAGEKHNLFDGLGAWMGDFETAREMMAQMMYNVMVDKGVVLPNENEIQAALNKIPDVSNVGNSYRTAVAVCYCLDLLSGVDASGTFAPKGILNRAQTAVIYVRLKKAINVPSGVPGTAAPDATLTNGMPVTEKNVLALIEEYRNGKGPGEKAREAGFTSYMDMSHYDAYNPPYSTRLSDGSHSGTECAKFAFAFFDDIFGTDVPTREVTNPADVRPGDLIRFSGHWCIASGEALYYSEDNYCEVPNVGGGSAGQIGWGDGSNVNRAIAIYTRYPE